MQLEYNLFLLLLDVALVAGLRRRPDLHPLALGALHVGIGEVVAMALYMQRVLPDGFAWFRLSAWLLFLHLPLLLLLAAGLTRAHWRRTAWAMVAAAVAVIAVAVDAFLVEPRWLEVERVTVESDEIDAPIRIVVLSDIQTDDVGAWEASVFARAMAEDPDLLLFPGDFVQLSEEHEYAAQRDAFNALVREHVPALPLGAFAVQGNVDYRRSWPELFRDTHVTPIVETTTLDLAEGVRLTGLGFVDGQAGTSVPAGPGFHVAFAHYPDFALHDVQADLLIAGHTHGGQVQLPILGPILTLSGVPRDWAAGTTKLPGGRTLIVSRGIGMERENAPRLRFLCRPQIVVVDVVPAERGPGHQASTDGEDGTPPIR